MPTTYSGLPWDSLLFWLVSRGKTEDGTDRPPAMCGLTCVLTIVSVCGSRVAVYVCLHVR